ncbi:AMP-binding protein [Larsenimonas rhizosphaerae]|uniref:AMP-binding protein n=1 Tax=Larsenimonas rhizosphaerae TaxID=2944682 RepID=UPI002033F685|nr:AMP-binding protein [Larsenimonas rhizosphaerae]MCM2131737.1 AMP-binding protein [Larsenimonas rhizosphaerae]
MIPILDESRFLDAPWHYRHDSTVVAAGINEQKCIADLHRDIAAWQQAPIGPDQKAVLYHPGPWPFVCALLACWHRGIPVVLPGDDRQDTLSQLTREGDVLLGEAPHAWQPCLDDDIIARPAWGPLRADAPAMEIFTSGSSGDPQRLIKTFRQLAHETCAFGNTFALPEGVIASQVSHQHIYGLSAGLLRALVQDRPFGLNICRYPEEVARYLEHMPMAALISSPAQLERIPEALLPPDGRRPGSVYSSGAPLSLPACHHAEARLSVSIIEIYGSSETGAIAWRDQRADPAWTPFDDTDIEEQDGVLRLRSPRLDTADWQRHADRIKHLQGRRFELLGRADRIVKVAGKRVSLDGMVRHLKAHPDVQRADCVELAFSGGRLGAIVQLEASAVPHHREARRRLIASLRETLERQFEPVAVPRYWRFTTVWPTNAQGKLTRALIDELFADVMDHERPRWLGSELESDTRLIVHLEVPDTLRALEGHFTGMPIVPGVALLTWCMEYAHRQWPDAGTAGRIERLRFPRPVRPGQRLTLTLEWREDTLHFRVGSCEGDHASGRARCEEQR